jgi:hypothetical protein
MADDEVTKMIDKLGDLNTVTFKAGLEFQGLTRRLITMSDNISGSGKKWTIFSRIVSGSPIWKLQNKIRAFVDSLALIEQASKKNSEAQREANERVINLVKSNEKMGLGLKQVALQSEMIRKLDIDVTKGIINKQRATVLLNQARASTQAKADEEEAVINTLAYNKALLLGKHPLRAYSEGIKELGLKAETTLKTFKTAKQDALIQDALIGDDKTFKHRMRSVDKAVKAIKERRKEELGFGKMFQNVGDFFLGTKGERKREGMSETGNIFQRFGNKIDVITKIQRMRIKYEDFMTKFAKFSKGILNYLFKTLIFITMAILGFFILLKVAQNAYEFLEELGAIEQIIEIGRMLMEAASLIFGMIVALVENDLDTLLEKGGQLAGVLLDIAVTTGIVALKAIYALGVSLFYTLIDLGIRFVKGDFNDILFKVAKFLLIALGAKIIIGAMIQVAAIAALPLLILGVAFLLMAAFFKKAKGMLPFMAEGGVSDGGITVVGEKGPELVNLPKGARVHSNADSKKMLKGSQNNNSSVFNNTVNVTINAKDTSDAELRRIADKIGNMVTNKIQRSVSSSGFVR